MLQTAYEYPGPALVRYPRAPARGRGAGHCTPLAIGRGEIRRRGSRVALLSFGTTLELALAAAAELGATVANMRFVKPLDEALCWSRPTPTSWS